MNEKRLYLCAPLIEFYQGQFLGVESIQSLMKKGDFGLGTFDHLDGEMIVLDGKVYQVKSDGLVYRPDENLTVPYAQLVSFAPLREFSVKGTLPNRELESLLDAKLGNLGLNYAIKIVGSFETMKVRSVKRQTQPFPTISQAILFQSVFELGKVKGTLIGFRLSLETLKGTDWLPYHFHFVTPDEKAGGHVLDLQIESGAAEIMPLDSIEIGNLGCC